MRVFEALPLSSQAPQFNQLVVVPSAFIRSQFLLLAQAATAVVHAVCERAPSNIVPRLLSARKLLLFDKCLPRTKAGMRQIMVVPVMTAPQIVNAVSSLPVPQVAVERVPATPDPLEVVPGVEVLVVMGSVVVAEVEVIRADLNEHVQE